MDGDIYSISYISYISDILSGFYWCWPFTEDTAVRLYIANLDLLYDRFMVENYSIHPQNKNYMEKTFHPDYVLTMKAQGI